MENKSRIPALREVTFDGALMWFSELHCEGLLFHPEDDPADIFAVSDGSPTFTSKEVAEVRFFIDEMDKGLGHDKMIEAAYPVFMKAYGIQLDA